MENQVVNQVELTPTEDSVYKMILRRVSDEFHAMDDVKCSMDRSNPNVRSFIVEIVDSNFAVYGVLDSVDNGKGVNVKESKFGYHRVIIDVSRNDIEADDIATNVVESIVDLMQKHDESASADVEVEDTEDVSEHEDASVEADSAETASDTVDEPVEKSAKSSGRGSPRPILIDGKRYDSALEGHRQTGLSKSTIWSWLQKDPASSRARYAD